MTLCCHKPSVPVCVPVAKGKPISLSREVPIALAKLPSFNAQKNKLLALADKMEVKLRRKYKAAIESIKEATSVKKLAAIIDKGGTVDEVLDSLGIQHARTHFAEVSSTIQEGYVGAGALTASGTSGVIGGGKLIKVTFDGYNARAVSFLQDRTLSLIEGLSKDSRATVKEVLINAQRNNIPPVDAAREIRSMIGLSDRQRNAVRNYQQFLQTADRRALNRSIGGNAERTVRAAFRDDTMTPAKVVELTDKYASRLLAQRADTIARTESFSAVQAAAHESWNQVFEQNDVEPKDIRRYWVATNDARTRDAHLEIVLMNEDGVGMNEPFDSPLGPIMYPGDTNADPANSINCRCTVVYRFVDIPKEALMPEIAGRSFLPSANDFTNQTGRDKYD